MDLRMAEYKDLDTLCKYDKHICREEIENLLSCDRIIIAEEKGKFIGWLRYNLFWDNTPFMNMIFILEEYRGNGYGRQIVDYWEKKMKLLNYEFVMTSTASDEYAQHFYVKLGYKAVGGFTYPGDPYEIIFIKNF